MVKINYLKSQPAILLKWINGLSIIGFFKSVYYLSFGSIKRPMIFYGYNHETFARWYKLKRELLYHRQWNQMGKAQFILKFVPGKLIVCSRLELELYKKAGLLSKDASIRKIIRGSI